MSTPIAALVPTRRPENIARLLECADHTGTSLVTWFIGIDEDDDQDYPIGDATGRRRQDVQLITSPQAQLAIKTNELAELTWNDFPILAQFDDDQWPRTPGWDTAVLAAMDDLQGGLVYTDDGWMGEQTPVCPFWPAKFAQRIGWLYHPDLIHLFADNTLQELARAIDRVSYLPHILIEHMHPIVGKSDMDASYEESNSGHTWSHDETVFRQYVASRQFQEHTAALREVIDAGNVCG